MKLKKWFEKLLIAINFLTMMFVGMIDDFELCWSALFIFAGVFSIWFMTSCVLCRYGRVFNEED